MKPETEIVTVYIPIVGIDNSGFSASAESGVTRTIAQLKAMFKDDPVMLAQISRVQNAK